MPLYKEVTIPMEECGVRLDMELITQAKQRVSEDLVRYHSIVTKELLEKPEVRTWVMYRAMEDYPPSNKGAFAQELVEELKLPFDKLASGKYSITTNSVANLEEGPIKSFFETNDTTFLEEDIKIKIAVKMWKDQNNGNYFNIQSKCM
jgi:hypothetical protein